MTILLTLCIFLYLFSGCFCNICRFHHLRAECRYRVDGISMIHIVSTINQCNEPIDITFTLKIDEDAVKGMTDEELSEFLPNKGDRYALRNFLSNKTSSSNTKSKKLSLMDKLRERLTNRGNTRSSTDEESSRRKLPKLNAKKEMHRVDLGWYHYDISRHSYVQVREKFGGGTRSLLLDKKMNKRAVINQCLELFFPEGESRHGSLSDMIVDLTDFQLKPLPDEETTIGDMIDKAKLHKIRFYLNTKLRNIENREEEVPKLKFRKSSKSSSTSNSSKDKEHEAINNVPISFQSSKNGNGQEKVEIESPEVNEIKSSEEVETKSPKEAFTVETCSSQNPDLSIQSEQSTQVQDFTVHPEQSFLFIENSIDIDNSLTEGSAGASNVWEDSLGEVAFTHVMPVREPKEFKIIVHRGHILLDLIKLFKPNPDVDFYTDYIAGQIILPNGEKERALDSGGVMRDMLTEFWEDFYEQCTTGHTIKIPCLRHDFEPSDWKAVARIIVMGWVLQKMLPIRLSPSFLKSSLYGTVIDIDHVRDEFLLFIPPGEQQIIRIAMENFDAVDEEELLEVLSLHESKVKATKENIGTVVDQIAHMELVQETAFVRDCFLEVLILYSFNINVDEEYKKMEPSSKKLLSILTCSEPDSESFKYLKRYIREMDTDLKKMCSFLRFITASDLLLYDNDGKYHTITVRIVDLEGMSRRPIAHTCGRVLELPRTYESYVIFKCELNAVLNSNVWVMDMA